MWYKGKWVTEASQIIKSEYYNKFTDKTVLMHRLICTFAIGMHQNQALRL